MATNYDRLTSPDEEVSVQATEAEWEDVTQAFNDAKRHMHVGEMIYSKKFNLFAAMSAIELMDPKMDVGCGVTRDLRDIELPPSLSDSQVINIMDHLLACEMSWLDSHTLPQTVFSCVYVQRLAEVPRLDLFYFLRLQLATMHCIVNLIVEEKVAEEEDFVAWTFGFRLLQLESRHSDQEEDNLDKMLAECDYRQIAKTALEKSTASAIMLRMRFRVLLYRALRCLAGHYSHKSPFEAAQLNEELTLLTQQWAQCPHRQIVDEQLINLVFDPSINRHLLTSTPPRTAPIFDVSAALAYLQRLLVEIRALISLKQYALPSDMRSDSKTGSLPRYSLHVAIQALETFCGEYNPKVLTRSLMSRLIMMIPERSTFMFDNEGANFIGMLATDMGLPEQPEHIDAVEDSRILRDAVVSIFECFCRNRSRQRRQLLSVLRWWDHCGKLAMRHSKEQKNKNDNTFSNINEPHSKSNKSNENPDLENHDVVDTIDLENKPQMDSPGNELSKKSPLQIIVYEMCCRLMIRHWLLGFECELYREFEFAAIFFYVGYVLKSLGNATAVLANDGLKGAVLHPLRLALDLMDKARLWLCRALHQTLEALSKGEQWSFTCRRSKLQTHGRRNMFGSEELWYEQRFGVVIDLSNAPPYANHSTYTTFIKGQEESLLADGHQSDIIELQLRDAANSFITARRKLEKSNKTVQSCAPNMMVDEIYKLGRVAVENSLTVSQALQNYIAQRDKNSVSKRFDVGFLFTRHRHFPVIKITEKS